MTEPGEVGAAVKGEAVAGDQVAVVDTHGADLVVADPDPGVGGSGPSDAVILTQVDDDLLQGVDVPFHPEQRLPGGRLGREVPEVQDRIGHQLTRAVERDQTSAICPDKVCAEGSESLLLVLGIFPGPHPRGVDGRVLDQDHGVPALPPLGDVCLDPGHELVLDAEGGEVAHPTQPQHRHQLLAHHLDRLLVHELAHVRCVRVTDGVKLPPAESHLILDAERVMSRQSCLSPEL